MTHWHFYRVRWGQVEQQPDGVDVDVDLFFARNRYDTAIAAATALVKDVVQQYPAAEHLPSHAQAQTALFERPASTYQYLSPVDGAAIWRLAECPDKCNRTLQTTAQLIQRELAERLAAHYPHP